MFFGTLSNCLANNDLWSKSGVFWRLCFSWKKMFERSWETVCRGRWFCETDRRKSHSNLRRKERARRLVRLVLWWRAAISWKDRPALRRRQGRRPPPRLHGSWKITLLGIRCYRFRCRPSQVRRFFQWFNFVDCRTCWLKLNWRRSTARSWSCDAILHQKAQFDWWCHLFLLHEALTTRNHR